MKFVFFHLMPYPYLPEDFDEKHPSPSLTFPNKHFDPELGHRLYHRYLDELEHADRLGFDGIGVNEHHQTAYGLMPSPNIMAAALARRTENAQIMVLGNAIGIRGNPLRVAEEIAMLDHLCNGRLVSGFVRGIGWEHFAHSIDPTRSRDRHRRHHPRPDHHEHGALRLPRPPNSAPARRPGRHGRGHLNGVVGTVDMVAGRR